MSIVSCPTDRGNDPTVDSDETERVDCEHGRDGNGQLDDGNGPLHDGNGHLHDGNGPLHGDQWMLVQKGNRVIKDGLVQCKSEYEADNLRREVEEEPFRLRTTTRVFNISLPRRLPPKIITNEAAMEPEEGAAGAGAGNDNDNRSKHPSPTQENARYSKRTRRGVYRGVYEESGMTDQERRQLRRDQRQLHETIRQDKREAFASAATATATGDDGDDNDDDDDSAVADAPMEFLQSARQHNNVLFEDVCYTREAVLDAENYKLIAQKYGEQVERLVQVPRYDPVKFVHKLVQKCTDETSGSSYFDWRTLGAECGICFNALPERVSFLAGPLDAQLKEPTEKKARVVRQRAVAEKGEEVRPELVQAGDGKNNDVDQTSALLKEMKMKLKDRCRTEYKTNLEERDAGDEAAEKLIQETGTEIDGVQYLFNPDSFTQTVENIFHYSFLIKKGEAAIGVGSRRTQAPVESSQPQSEFGQQGLWVKPMKSKETVVESTQTVVESTQSVVAFTMKDFRAMCQSHDLKKGDLPHRTNESQQPSSQDSVAD